MSDASPADWMAAVGTVGAFAVGFIQIWRERRARRQLEVQAAARERRTQAERISAWLLQGGERRTAIALSNRSEAPVYEAVVSLVLIQGAGPRIGEELQEHEYRSTVAVIPPGESYTTVAGGWGGMSRVPGAEIAFTDAQGAHWVRRADGTLLEIDQEPADHFQLPRPRGWMTPHSLPADRSWPGDP